MIYSYTQISQYLSCPRRYRYRYLDGWVEKETRAGLLFGRAFENAVAALFRREHPGQALFDNWSPYRNLALEYSRGDTWDSMLESGIHLLERFAQDGRVHIPRLVTTCRSSSLAKSQLATSSSPIIDAKGHLDGKRSVIDWKTTAARYPEEPAGLLALDPQLTAYSWVTGEPEMAFVVFVRKRQPEVQYLATTITAEQRQQFGALVHETIRQIESAEFLPRPGIRFPQNGCLSCPYVGLCLGNQELANSQIVRRPGGEDLGWLDELRY